MCTYACHKCKHLYTFYDAILIWKLSWKCSHPFTWTLKPSLSKAGLSVATAVQKRGNSSLG